MQPPHMVLPLDKIMKTQEAAMSKTTQAKDASRLREFLQFCEGHGIKSGKAFPAKEELLVAWAGSYAGRLAGKTVSAKLGAIKKEHERRGLVWQGGMLLRRTLKGVEEMRNSVSSKRGRIISMPKDFTAAGDVKPATPKTESDNSPQCDDDDDEVKAQPVITVEDSSESDSDGDVEMVDGRVSSNGSSSKRKATDDAQPQAKKVKLDGDAPEESKIIFVGRLSWSVDNDWLAHEFAHCGKVESANVQIDRDSGQSKGFGYVRFTTSEAVEKALLMNGQEIDGRAVNIARDNRGKGFGDKQRSPPSSSLFVGNLSSDISEDTVWSLFEDYGVKSVRIPTDRDTGLLKGFGYVGFEDVDSAKKALEARKGADIEGRSIRLDYFRDSSEWSRSGGRGFGDRIRGGGRGFGDFGGRGGFRGRGGGRGNDGRGRGAPRGVASFEGKKIVFELTMEDQKIA